MTKTTKTEPEKSIAPYWVELPRSLFNWMGEWAGELLPSHQRVALVLEVIRVEERVVSLDTGKGRPRHSRKAMARAFIAKALLGMPTTEFLRERLIWDLGLRALCGFWDGVPSRSTFSRAFCELATDEVLDKALEAAVRTHLGQEVIHHCSIDSSAILARERPPAKNRAPWTQRRKNESRPKSEPTRQERQVDQSAKQALLELPTLADWGIKMGSQGHREKWRGFKIHVAVGDGGIPLAAYTTSATLHDSQVAIPLIKLSAERVKQMLYCLMDKAYQGEPIKAVAASLGQVAIVPPRHVNKDKPAPELDFAYQDRFKERTCVERFFSRLKDSHGGKSIYVQGPQKVHAHLMCGVLGIFALCILRL